MANRYKPADPHISVKLPVELKTLIEKYAADHAISVSAVVRIVMSEASRNGRLGQ